MQSVQRPASDAGVPEVAPGNHASTLSHASENKPEMNNSNPAADTTSAAPYLNKKIKDMKANMHHNDKPAHHNGENHKNNHMHNHGHGKPHPHHKEETEDESGVSAQSDDGITAASETAETVAGGVLLSEQPSVKGTYPVTGDSFTIREGGATVTLRITADDSGYLNVTDANKNVVLSAAGGVDDWHLTKDENHWHDEQSAFLPAGSYDVAGEVTNADMAPYNNQNLLYCRYEITWYLHKKCYH